MLRRCVAYLFGCCLTLLTIPVSAQYINRTNSVLALAGYKDPGLRSAETCRTYGKGNLLSPMMFNAQLANYFAKTYGVSDGPGLPVQIMTDAEIKAAEKYYEDALAKSTLTSSPTCAEVLQLIVDARNQFADRAFSRADAIANKNRAKCSDEIRNKLPVSTYCRNGDTILRLFAYSASSPDNFADVFKSNGITNLLLMAGKGDLKGVQGMMANPQNGLVNANSADPAEGLTPLIAAAEHFSVTVAINGVDLGDGSDYLALIKWLVDNKADVNVPYRAKHCKSPLTCLNWSIDSLKLAKPANLTWSTQTNLVLKNAALAVEYLKSHGAK